MIKAKLTNKALDVILEIPQDELGQILEFARLGTNYFYAQVSGQCMNEAERDQCDKSRADFLAFLRDVRRIVENAPESIR